MSARSLIMILVVPVIRLFGAWLTPECLCQTVTLADVQRRLAKREEHFRTIDLRFTRDVDQRLVAPGGTSSQLLAEPISTKRIYRYSLDGTRWSLREEGDTLELSTQKLAPRQSVSMFEGKRSKGYRRVTTTKHGTTILGALASASDKRQTDNPAQTLDFLPIALSFRPLSWGLGIEFPKQARIRSVRGVIDGRTHVILEMQSSPQMKREVWLDWDRGAVIARHATFIRGVRRSQLDISHWQRPGVSEWEMSGWRFVHTTAKGEVDMSHDVAVTSLAVNEPIPPDIWDVHFPAGTLVYDTIAN
jgi:hypothetical protein